MLRQLAACAPMLAYGIICLLQVITLDHDKYVRELNNIADSHKKSVQVCELLLPLDPLCKG